MTHLQSAIYEGIVRHKRVAPTRHAFEYRMAQLYLDLDELDRVFEGRWFWSHCRRNVAEFRRADYLGPVDRPLAEAVRDCVKAAIGDRPDGPVRLLTHLRYWGYVFNPVSFYYCHAADGRLASIVAEITNTPWGERHAYVLPIGDAKPRGRALVWTFGKSFHVSPFMAMDREYAWSFTPPGEDLLVHMKVSSDRIQEFSAGLRLRRQALSGPALARVLWRYPAMTAQVITAIRWQALRLWLKRTPVYPHPAVMDKST